MIIFKQALKRIFLSKARFVILILLPMLFIAMFALRAEPKAFIGVVDKDGSALSERFVAMIKQMDHAQALILQEDEVSDRTVSYNVDYSIIIESGFENKILTGEKPDVKEFYLEEKEVLYFIRSGIESYLSNIRRMANGVDYNRDKLAEALALYDKEALGVRNTSDDNGKLPQTRLAMGFLIQFMLYMSVITAGLILEDKVKGIFPRVFYAPVSLKRYLGENLAAFLVAAVTQVSIMLAALMLIFGMKIGEHPLSMFVLLMFFSITCITLGMWIVSIFKKPIQAYVCITFATTPLVMLGGCYWPSDYMPEIMREIGDFIPVSWAMEGVDAILYESKDIFSLSTNVLVLLLFSGIFFAAGLIRKVDIAK